MAADARGIQFVVFQIKQVIISYLFIYLFMDYEVLSNKI